MRILGIIPARAGSKGITRKNVKLLAGCPLLTYTIRAALNAKCLDRLILSTDHAEIAQIGKAAGAECPWLRPSSLAEDNSPVVDVAIDVLDRLREEGYQTEGVLLLQPTSPFRSASTIRQAVAQFTTAGGESVISVSPCPLRYHPLWCKRLSADGSLESFIPTISPPQRQHLPQAYALDGCIYLATEATLRRSRTFHSEHSRAYITPANENLDIDTPDDWEAAERLMAKPRLQS